MHKKSVFDQNDRNLCWPGHSACMNTCFCHETPTFACPRPLAELRQVNETTDY